MRFRLGASQKQAKPELHATRYSIRVQAPGREIEEVGIGRDRDAAVQFARLHHETYGHRIWVWNVRTGAVIFELQRKARAAGGGQ